MCIRKFPTVKTVSARRPTLALHLPHHLNDWPTVADLAVPAVFEASDAALAAAPAVPVAAAAASLSPREDALSGVPIGSSEWFIYIQSTSPIGFYHSHIRFGVRMNRI